ncbi:hypothetical protein D6C81_06258, partial [Aureobasidium pullulans]
HIHERSYPKHPVALERTKNQRSLVSFEYRSFDDMSQSCGPEHSEAYTVAWIAALPHERAAGEAMFDEEYEDPPVDFIQNSGDPNAYSWGRIGKHYIVVAALPSGEYGLTPTAIVAQGLRSSLPHVRIGLLVGIGAAVREILDKEGTTVDQRDIRLGDVVVSSPEGTIGGVVQCDLVKAQTVDGSEVLQRHGSLSSPPLALRTALAKLQASHFKKGSTINAIIAEAFEKWSEMKDKFYHPGLEANETNRRTDTYHSRGGTSISNEARRSPKIHYGTVASSNTLEKSARHRDAVLIRLAKENINPSCFEMEAAGLMNNFPCLVIRGICDYGDEHKNDHWQNYAAITAAGVAKELLRCVNVQQVQETQGIGNLILKRHDHEVHSLFDGDPTLRIQAHAEDLTLYTTKRADELVPNIRHDVGLIGNVIKGVIDASDGVFLLARLHMNSINDQLTANEVKDTLNGLRKDTGSYSSAYEATMKRINQQQKRRSDLGKRILAWVVHAKRPLSFEELNHALATRPGKRSIESGDMYAKEVILSVCVGLVTLDVETLRLIHYTAQEFFRDNWMQWLPNETTAIVDTCITYLSFDVFKEGPCRNDDSLKSRLNQYKLLGYAARNWGHHLRDQDSLAETDRTTTETVLSFLEDTPLTLSGSQAMDMTVVELHERLHGAHSGGQGNKPKALIIFHEGMYGVHLAAFFGLEHLTMLLIEKQQDADIRDSHGRTPLWWAANNGFAGLVKTLSGTQSVDLNKGDVKNRSRACTPLSIAAIRGHEDIVQILLNTGHLSISKADDWGGDPLRDAAGNGHEGVIKVLLATKGVDVNSKDLGGRTPLIHAVRYGHERVVKALLAAEGVDVHWRGPLALDMARRGSHAGIIRLLEAAGTSDTSGPTTGGTTNKRKHAKTKKQKTIYE